MAVTGQNGKVKYSYNYSPYGELLEGEYSDTIPFLYNGQYGVTTDSNGLYYMRARYYNVNIKRFINQDVLTGTLERIGSLNRYAYVEGNPVSYLDPFGLESTIMDEIHSMIETISATLTLIMTALAITAVLGTASGNLEITAYASYYYIICNNISKVVAFINAGLYFREAFTKEEADRKEYLFGAATSLYSAVSTNFIDSADNMFKMKEMIKSLLVWCGSDIGKMIVKEADNYVQ